MFFWIVIKLSKVIEVVDMMYFLFLWDVRVEGMVIIVCVVWGKEVKGIIYWEDVGFVWLWSKVFVVNVLWWVEVIEESLDVCVS